MQETVECIVGRLQVKEHLPDLGVVQLVGGRHAAQGGQPAREMGAAQDARVGRGDGHKHTWKQVPALQNTAVSNVHLIFSSFLTEIRCKHLDIKSHLIH